MKWKQTHHFTTVTFLSFLQFFSCCCCLLFASLVQVNNCSPYTKPTPKYKIKIKTGTSVLVYVDGRLIREKWRQDVPVKRHSNRDLVTQLYTWPSSNPVTAAQSSNLETPLLILFFIFISRCLVSMSFYFYALNQKPNIWFVTAPHSTIHDILKCIPFINKCKYPFFCFYPQHYVIFTIYTREL